MSPSLFCLYHTTLPLYMEFTTWIPGDMEHGDLTFSSLLLLSPRDRRLHTHTFPSWPGLHCRLPYLTHALPYTQRTFSPLSLSSLSSFSGGEEGLPLLHTTGRKENWENAYQSGYLFSHIWVEHGILPFSSLPSSISLLSSLYSLGTFSFFLL